MNKNIGIAIAILVGILAVAGFWYMSQAPGSPTSGAKGRVVFAVKDHAELTDITSIMMTVNSVETHSASEGWITASTTPKQYDLVKLKASGAAELFADARLPVGIYDQIRLTIGRVDVTVDGKISEAKLPSHVLRIVGKVVVREGETTAVVFDLMADRSLHTTIDGRFILAPVVKLETRSGATLQITSDNKVVISGGKVEADETSGMDEEGEMRDDFELDGDIEIDVNGVIHVEGDDDDDRDEVRINLRSINDSGVSGVAVFEEKNGKVEVSVKLGATSPALLLPAKPAHIHVGSCPGVGAVKYPLSSIVNGSSETTLAVTMDQLKAGLPLALNVHKSAAEPAAYIACGELSL